MTGTDGISDELAQLLLHDLPFGIVVLAPLRDGAAPDLRQEDRPITDVRFEYVNEQASRLLGYPPAGLAGVRMSELSSPRAGAVVLELCDRVMRTDRAIDDVVPARTGMLRVIARRVGGVVLLVARDPMGDSSGAAVEQMRESLESTSDNLAILEPLRDERGDISDFALSFVNDRALRSIGLPVTDSLGVPLREAMPGYPEGLLEGYRQVMQTGVPFVTEYEMRTRRGVATLHIVATRYQGGLIVATRDTSAQSNAQRELAQSEARFRSTVEAMTEAVAVLRAIRDANGRIADFELAFVNAAAEELLRPQTGVIGRRLLDVRPELAGFGVVERLATVVTTGAPDALELPWNLDGELGSIEASIVRLDDGVVAVGRDITERRRHQRRVEDSERRFHMLAENAGDAVLYGTVDGLLWVSPSVETLLGWKPEELIGRPPIDLIHPDDRASLLAARADYGPGRSTRTRLRVLHRDGSSLWVESLARPLPGLEGADDSLIVSTFWSVQAEVEAQEALARAEAERRLSEARLNQAARLESLGVMAGGIAHDFNNLLVGVLGNAEIALLQLPPDAPVRERLERITLAAQRAADLTRQLLDYTGSRTGPLDLVDVVGLVDETLDLVAARLPAATTIVSRATPDVPVVRGDRGQLQQVVMNLVINASDALAGRPGRVEIAVGVAHLGSMTAPSHSPVGDLAPGRYVTVSVVDDGPGMSSDTLLRVFEPFFTTKPTGRGLGLAVVHGVVRAHHGTVVPASSPGVGTTMTVYLPAAEPDANPTSAGAKERPAVHASSSPRVLVIDDDDGVREVSSLVLERAGMVVRGDRDGRTALAAFAAAPMSFDAVLLDLTMPEMSGDEVLAELRRIRPDVPVVLISGYSDAEVDDRLAALTIQGFVKKPFRPVTLVEAIERAIAGAATAGS